VDKRGDTMTGQLRIEIPLADQPRYDYWLETGSTKIGNDDLESSGNSYLSLLAPTAPSPKGSPPSTIPPSDVARLLLVGLRSMEKSLFTSLEFTTAVDDPTKSEAVIRLSDKKIDSTSYNIEIVSGNPSGSCNVFIDGQLRAKNVNFTALHLDASRERMGDSVHELTADAARETLAQLKPVSFTHEEEPAQARSGFVAEDSPAALIGPDGQSIAPLDLIAVLTRVVQHHEATIADLTRTVTDLTARVRTLEQRRTRSGSTTQRRGKGGESGQQ
jgi:hypothetical protein